LRDELKQRSTEKGNNWLSKIEQDMYREISGKEVGRIISVWREMNKKVCKHQPAESGSKYEREKRC
jgi:hypothetical protein